MALMGEFPIVSSNIKAGLGVYGTMDTFDATKQNNGARNPLGSVWFMPSPAQSGWTVGGGAPLTTQNGYAMGLWVKYVRYNSTSNPALTSTGGPVPVYYTDETFTTVTGVFSEGIPASTGNASSVAGWMLINNGTGTYGVGTTLLTNTLLNGNYVFIGISGFIPGAYLAAGAQGNGLVGASGNFTVAVVTGVLRPFAYVIGSVSSNIGDILATLPPF